MRVLLNVVLAVSLLVSVACAEVTFIGPKPAGNVGKRWIRSHPFVMMGLCLYPHGPDVDRYRKAGLSYMLAWKTHDGHKPDSLTGIIGIGELGTVG